MQYALLISSRPGATEALSPSEQEAVHREYMALRQVPGMVGGAALHPAETATTVRLQDERILAAPGVGDAAGGGGTGLTPGRHRTPAISVALYPPGGLSGDMKSSRLISGGGGMSARCRWRGGRG
jgi:hypothetical protein